MSNLKLPYTILRLKGIEITCYGFRNRGKGLHLMGKLYKNDCRCQECGRRGKIVHQSAELRSWQNLTLMSLNVLLWYAPRETFCPTHGRLQEFIP